MLNTQKMLNSYLDPVRKDPVLLESLLQKLGLYSAYVARNPSLLGAVQVNCDYMGNAVIYTLTVCGDTVIKFQFASYPACCGVNLFHTFYCKSGIPTDFFNDLMDCAMADVLCKYRGDHPQSAPRWACWRIQVMMIEPERHWTAEENALCNKDGQFMEIPVRKNPVIQYQPIYNWLHTKRKVVETLMFNLNSNNVIHNMEVMFDPKLPICKEYA